MSPARHPAHVGVPMEKADQNSLGLVRLKSVLELLQISKSTLYAEIKAGRLPAPLHITSRTSAWRITDIMAVIDKRAAALQHRKELT